MTIGKEDFGRLEEAGRILRAIAGVDGAVVVLFRENFQQAEFVNVGCPRARVLQLAGEAIAGLRDQAQGERPRIIVPPDMRGFN